MEAKRPTLLDVRNAGEYATKFRWTLDMRFLPPVVKANADHLNVLCSSSSLPTKTIADMPIEVRGHKHFQPGIATPNGRIDLVFYETVNSQIHVMFLSWQEKIWAHNTGVGVSYDKLIADKICLHRLDNQDKVICTYVLRWCFLESYTNPTLSGNASDTIKCTVALSYNDFYLTNVPGLMGVYPLITMP